MTDIAGALGRMLAGAGIVRLILVGWAAVTCAALLRTSDHTLVWLWPQLVKGWKICVVLVFLEAVVKILFLSAHYLVNRNVDSTRRPGARKG